MFEKSPFAMSAQPYPASPITPEAYLAAERQADFKSEYYQGRVTAMAGASNEHNLIVANLIIELGTKLRERDCTVRASDMRLQVSSAGLYTYPDVSVVCGPPEFRPDADLDTLLNPTLLVEVISKSTAQHDRGNKFLFYRSISSLQYYLLVEPQAAEVAVYTRQDNESWLFQAYEGLHQYIPLPALNLRLALSEIYRKVL